MNELIPLLGERYKRLFTELQALVPCRLQFVTSSKLRNGVMSARHHDFRASALVYFNDLLVLQEPRSRAERTERSSRGIIESTNDLVAINAIVSAEGMTPGQLIIEEAILLDGAMRENLLRCVAILLAANSVPLFTFKEDHFLPDIKRRDKASCVKRRADVTAGVHDASHLN